MKKKIFGILICMLFIGISIVPSFESYKTNKKIENAPNESYLFGDLEKLNDSGISLSNKEIEFTSSNNFILWVIYPNGGEILDNDTIIYWDWEETPGIYYEYYKIYCVGQSNTYTLSTHCTNYNNEFLWHTTKILDGSYKIKVELWGTNDWQHPEPSHLIDYDYSDDWFTIDNNNPPNKPTINGEVNGKPNREYEYNFMSTDLDGDEISYYIDWGDNSTTGWTTSLPSGEYYNSSHIWSEPGNYTIKAKAKDTSGDESDWATLSISMPKSKAINTPFLQFLQQHPTDDDPDYLWEVRMILWGKNLYINNEPYTGGKLVIESGRDLENPDWIEIYFDDESCRSLLTVWITPFIRITVPYNHYGLAELANFNGIITPGLKENSYIIRGTTYGTCCFYERE
jgi:hypothetical protein